MPKIEKPDMSPRKEQELAYLRAKVEQQEADIAFVAMMADVELEGEGDAEVGAD